MPIVPDPHRHTLSADIEQQGAAADFLRPGVPAGAGAEQRQLDQPISVNGFQAAAQLGKNRLRLAGLGDGHEISVAILVNYCIPMVWGAYGD